MLNIHPPYFHVIGGQVCLKFTSEATTKVYYKFMKYLIKEKKEPRNFLWFLENHILTVLIKWNKRSLNLVFYLLCATA